MECNIKQLDVVKLKAPYALLPEGASGVVLSLAGTNFCLLQRKGYTTLKSTFWVPINLLTPILRKNGI